jgi:DDE family transposase
VLGLLPPGCDGSRQECPRTAELEQRLGRLGCKGKKEAAPTIWITAFVHLSTGLLWSWRLGKGVADERWHLRQLLPTLPAAALLVCDAGYVGYDLFATMLGQGTAFLVRLSSRDKVYVDEACSQAAFRDGPVYYWPKHVQKRQGRPIAARLLRLGKKGDVWLLTNLSRSQLRRKQAERYYRWRWKNEGLFRTYKHTVARVKLLGRSVPQVHREAEAALLAVQLLLAQGFLAMLPRKNARTLPVVSASPRALLLAIRAEITAGVGSLGPRQREDYWARLKRARCEQRRRHGPKACRAWSRRKPHRRPKPPKILKLTQAQQRLKTRVSTAA